jgi:hypothetical protein
MIIFIYICPSYAKLYDVGTNLLYDDVNDITWLADANYTVTSGYILTLSHTNPKGLMSWSKANTWATNLDFGGETDWRLPNYNELNYMYQEYLDLDASTLTIQQAADVISISNLQDFGYWLTTTCSSNSECGTNSCSNSVCSSRSGTLYKPMFNIHNGLYDEVPKDSARYAWAVHTGNIGTEISTNVILWDSSGGAVIWDSSGDKVLWE